MFVILRGLLLGIAVCVLCSSGALADDYKLDRFKVIPLTDVYYSEGANVGDVDGDGVIDAVYGPIWFKGPDFQEKRGQVRRLLAQAPGLRQRVE